MMETNTFKLMVNDDLEHTVEIYEKIFTRDKNGAVSDVQYDVWYRGERRYEEEEMSEAFLLAAEILLDATNK